MNLFIYFCVQYLKCLLRFSEMSITIVSPLQNQFLLRSWEERIWSEQKHLLRTVSFTTLFSSLENNISEKSFINVSELHEWVRQIPVRIAGNLFFANFKNEWMNKLNLHNRRRRFQSLYTKGKETDVFLLYSCQTLTSC